MQATLTVKRLIDEMSSGLGLQWLAGAAAADHLLSRDEDPGGNRPNLIGPLNLISPNRIQVLGAAEVQSLEKYSLDPNAEAMRQLFQSDCNVIIMAEDQSPPPVFIRLAGEYQIALLRSPALSHDIINTLRHRLTRFLTKKIILHGVLMDVLGMGVLITGDSSVGKSELALELISRGHTLVADDAPEFRNIAPDTIEGKCPDLLRDFLEVRGLGVLNIRQMYGHASTRRRKILKFIVHLAAMDYDELANSIDRLDGRQLTRNILGVDILERTIPVAPGRNLAVLVEAAVRNYMLTANGYDAAADLSAKQRSVMEQN
ncbi:MAG: HPr(Ser) kinase/phosphatase [Gammaproteobacteria bacterium]|nr:HPr(Ser) kinase/phosphatase [Gammaproteobacteria bacterium]